MTVIDGVQVGVNFQFVGNNGKFDCSIQGLVHRARG